MAQANKVITGLHDHDLQRLNEAAEQFGIPRATLVRVMIQQSLKRLDENITPWDETEVGE